MNYQLVVPGPIEDVEETRVLEWHGVEGQPVQAGALLVELETHKAVIEIRAARDGVLRQILCPQGLWQSVGKPLAIVSDTADEALPEGEASALPLFLFEYEIN